MAWPSHSQARVEIGLLGPFEVRGPVGVTQLGSRKERALLALLALHAGRYMTFSTLVSELWSDQAPAAAATTLRTLMSRLRSALGALGADRLLDRKPLLGYRLEVERDWVDALQFEHLVRKLPVDLALGDDTRAAANLTRLQAGLGLWRGPPLAEFTEYPFARFEAGRLDELRLEATEELVEAQLHLGKATDALGLLRRQVSDSPYREKSWGLLMLTLYRLGRQADALRTFQDLRAILDQDLGIEPSLALRQLELAVLRQSPELEGLRVHWGAP